jgi:branched-chain amino acid transport system substrate-binding protein
MTAPLFTRRKVVQLTAATAAAGALPILSARAATPIKVGVLLPTSGVYASSGQAARKGIEFGALINKEQGGPELELMFADTESKPENGRVAAEKLIRAGCSVLIGAWDTGATISAAQAAEAAKVPLVINIGSAPQITEQGFTQVFRNFTPVTSLIDNAVVRIKELAASSAKPPKTAVLLYVNDTYGQAALAGVSALWEKQNVPIKIVDKIGYDVKAKDLSVEVAKAKASGADLLLPLTRVNDAIMIVREAVKQSFNPMAIIGPGSAGPYERAFTDAVGKYGDDYMICVPWYNPQNPRAKALVERYENTEKGQRFELNVGFSFEAVEIVADAVKRAKSSDPAALHAALKTTNITDHVMYGGPIVFNEKGQNPNIGVVMLQNRNGAPIVVGPKEVAVAAPNFPMRPFDQR